MEVIFDVCSCFFHTMNWNFSSKFCEHFLTSLLALAFQVLGHSWRLFPWGQGQSVLGSRRCLWLEMWWMIAMPRPSLAELFCCELQQEGVTQSYLPLYFIALFFWDGRVYWLQATPGNVMFKPFLAVAKCSGFVFRDMGHMCMLKGWLT